MLVWPSGRGAYPPTWAPVARPTSTGPRRGEVGPRTNSAAALATAVSAAATFLAADAWERADSSNEQMHSKYSLPPLNRAGRLVHEATALYFEATPHIALHYTPPHSNPNSPPPSHHPASPTTPHFTTSQHITAHSLPHHPPHHITFAPSASLVGELGSLHYITLNCVTIHYITLQYITMHRITRYLRAVGVTGCLLGELGRVLLRSLQHLGGRRARCIGGQGCHNYPVHVML